MSSQMSAKLSKKLAQALLLTQCNALLLEDNVVFCSVSGLSENSLDALVFETLIPRPILQRYVSLLTEHRRIILSGPSGTGKTYLANRLSEHMVLREGRELSDGIIATFNVDHKSSKVRIPHCCFCPIGSCKPRLPLCRLISSMSGMCEVQLFLATNQ